MRLTVEEYLQPRHFYDFCRDVIGYKDLRPFPHMEVCNFIAGGSENYKKLLMVPRDTFKTSIGSVCYPIWLIMRSVIIDNNPWITILLDSAGKRHTAKTLQVIKKQFRSNRIIKENFGEFYDGRERDDSGKLIRAEFAYDHLNIYQRLTAPYDEGKTATTRQNTIDISGIGAEITGDHYDVIIADDWVTLLTYKSPAMRQAAIDRAKEVYSVANKGGSKLLILCTPWIKGDVYYYLMEKERDNFEVMKRSAKWKDAQGRTHYYFKERIDEEKLQRLKNVLGMRYWTQYMCEYMADEERLFNPDMYQEIEPEACRYYDSYHIFTDFASLEEKEDQGSLNVIMGVGFQRDKIVVDNLWAEKASQEDTLEKLFDLIFDINDEYGWISVEETAFHGWVGLAIRQRAESMGITVRLSKVKIPRTISKRDRICRLGYHWNNGLIYIKSTIADKYKRLFRDGFIDFPRSRYLDIPDCLETGLRKKGIMSVRHAQAMKKHGIPEMGTNENGEVELNINQILRGNAFAGR